LQLRFGKDIFSSNHFSPSRTKLSAIVGQAIRAIDVGKTTRTAYRRALRSETISTGFVSNAKDRVASLCLQNGASLAGHQRIHDANAEHYVEFLVAEI